MIINKIKLENIRSYVNQEINFPEGNVLLAGNIGSGKSTILFSIEFALFGLLKGDLTGSSLLRNGTKKGFVELSLNVEDKEITIKRVLKRGSKSVSQDSGSVIVNGEETLLSPIEIKQFVLDTISYPKEFLTQTKSLIYRYTVYTPQEEMKQILFSNNELRLDILRRIFGIDKYKKVKENSKLFLSKVKGRKAELLIRVENLQKEQEEKKSLESNILELNKEKEGLDLKINNLVKEINVIKQEISEKEELSNKLKELKNQENIIELKISNKNSEVERNKLNKERLIKEVEVLKNEVTVNEESKDFSLEIKTIDDKISVLNSEVQEISNKIQDIRTKKLASQGIVEKINTMDFCPLCKQNVIHDHKKSINSEENNKILELDNELKELESKNLVLNNEQEENKNKLSEIRELKSKYDVLNLKKVNLEDKNKQLNFIKVEEEKSIKEISVFNSEKEVIMNNIKLIPESNVDEVKSKLENLNSQEKEIQLNKARVETDISAKLSNIERLKESIEDKIKVKKDISKLEEIHFLVNEHFLSLVENMEKSIMLKIYADFSSLFQKWFGFLINNEDIQVSLERDFTPIIEQNGFIIEYQDLSGGEKTATALAYRLALNQVINNVVGVIKTKDLIILDEPTDGFSEEQIDRIRDVLKELNMKQIIIVSHEPKVESFVDNVIRLEKREHITNIL
ncbi:hypothetical protein CL617_01430 [archaeon]|nr:hypothetical protein [archaeon]